MDETYFVIYDKENDMYMSRNDCGDNEVDEDAWSYPQHADHFEEEETARENKKKYSNSGELIIVKVDVAYEFEELN